MTKEQEQAERDRKLGEAVRESLDHCFMAGDRAAMLADVADALNGEDVYHAAGLGSDVTPLLNTLARVLREESSR